MISSVLFPVTKMGSDDNSDGERKEHANEDDEELNIQLGPKVSLKEHLEKDKVWRSIPT